ncbi:hydrogenase assembly protein HupF [Candidatus Acidianus copahuensis]|uniref:Hydrogenase assembly protein HupF n=1 Tax=Candidatus Acidianus copahuensis TaxID=1160895 RepID=A0A031LJ71_9CREN|nr:hydrogenase expression/formation protein HypE [Candidatus Acidianus copahuensis]EZQ01601.1 hydrogenase assembly protein HupF [Candidatus Acidianus copahuensis]
MDKITIAHGNGGKETQQLLQRYLFSKLPEELKRTPGGVGIDYPDDGALVSNLVISTDSHTVNPYFFPGGSIGKLAVSGTLNDVIMMGGRPTAILDSIIVSEGFPLPSLDKIIDDMISVLREYKIPLIGGDFKVIPSDSMKGIVINTVGLGISKRPIVDKIRPGDSIIVTGPIGTHGAVIAALQYGIGTSLESDAKPLMKLLDLFEKFDQDIHAARDPTRGGLAATLNEWAQLSGEMIVVEEKKIPVLEEVKSISSMTGIDPLSLASEGVGVIALPSEKENEVLEELNKLGFTPAVIGRVLNPKDIENNSLVILRTLAGGTRILEMPVGDIVPRIC